jgi:hypothetical protein
MAMESGMTIATARKGCRPALHAGRIPNLVPRHQAAFSSLEEYLKGDGLTQTAESDPRSVSEMLGGDTSVRNSSQYRGIQQYAQLKFSGRLPGGEAGVERGEDCVDGRHDDGTTWIQQTGFCPQDLYDRSHDFCDRPSEFYSALTSRAYEW